MNRDHADDIRATHPRRLALTLIALGVAFAWIVAGCGGDGSSSTSTKDFEKAFLEAMLPHHESAIAMTQVAESRAESPEVRRIAAEIAANQGPEIEQMQEIHQRLFGSDLVADPAAHEVLGLSPEEAGAGHEDAAASLKTAQPFDRAFVDEMVPHHEGAIAMAEVALEEAEDSELRQLAMEIIAAQETEIEEMNMFREERYGEPAPEPGGEEVHGSSAGGEGHSE